MYRVKGIIETYIKCFKIILCQKSVSLNTMDLWLRVKPISTLYLQIGLED